MFFFFLGTESLTPGVNSPTSIPTRPTTGSVAESSGASLSSGFQTLFALFFGLFSILAVFFQNLNNFQTSKFTRRRAVSRRKECKEVSLPKHNYLKKLLHTLFHR